MGAGRGGGGGPWAAQRHGRVTFAVRTPQRLYGRGLDRQVPAASVLKAMLMVAYLRRGRVGAGDRALLRPMITRSDNVTATRVRDSHRQRRAGPPRPSRRHDAIRRRPIWGMSLITARDQTRFFLHLESLLPPRHRTYALRLLRSIVPLPALGDGAG